MKLGIKSIISILCLAVCGQAANSFGVAGTPYVFTDAALGGYQMSYRLVLPAGYDPNGPALPVILFLHGYGGAMGTNNTAQMDANVQPLLDATTLSTTGSQRAIVIVPQCPVGGVWNSKNLNNGVYNWTPGGTNTSSYSETPAQQAARPISNALQAAVDIVDYVKATQKVDSRKIYITGLSMGGFGTWDAITRYPGKFAAAMPLSGGGNVQAASTLVNTPIWAYHGTQDNIVYPNGSTNMIDAIRNSGGKKSVYTLQGGRGHQGWDQFYTPYSAVNQFSYRVGDQNTTSSQSTYNNYNVYDWLFAQSLPAPEPASVSLLILGCVGLLGRRSKHQ